MLRHFPTLGAFLSLAAISTASVIVTPERHDNEQAAPGFQFSKVPAPRRSDAAAKATFTLIDGERDPNGADVAGLHDGALPAGGDQPRANFFFRAGTDGGRVLVDLGSVIELKQVNTYSWHGGTRGPQVYHLYVSDGKAANFQGDLKRPAKPEENGWKLVADVDTQPKEGNPGGQYGVSITDSTGSLGQARYLLFDINRTEDADPFGNTFFSEIDVLDRNASEAPEPSLVESAETDGGEFRFTVDTNEAPDLTEWAHRDLVPVMKKWYPMIVKMLPSDGFNPPRNFSITFTNAYKGVAATGGNRIECSPSWYRQNLKTEAIGSLVHELVHVVQQYGRARRAGGARPPGWLVEGIPDYIRWYLYEPESHGCDISPKNAARAKFDASYRTSANFLNWVVGKYDKDLIKELNTAMREGRDTAEVWKARTNHTAEELGDEWKKGLTPATAAAQ